MSEPVEKLPGDEIAKSLDEQDDLKHLRNEFNIPSKADICRTTLPSSVPYTQLRQEESDKAIYLVGNSLGLQPKRTATRIQQYLSTWRTQGVQGHFKPLKDSPLPTWLDVDDRAAELVAPIVGGRVEEVAVMQTLTANLHLLMAAFYKPGLKGRHKIILEGKAFPSDHFVVETQIRHHGLKPEDSMILLEPPADADILSTEYIKSVIKEHASTTTLLLLPGIQYYTGQFLAIPEITAYARKQGIFVIWDLAHAVGNVPLKLHDWNVDAAAWCSYKYLNGGPGCIGGLFIHERNSKATLEDGTYPNRLAGWWGNDKASRFAMKPGFHPVPGAAGFQLSNPSVLDITALSASLEVFHLAGGVDAVRAKSLKLTAFLVSQLSTLEGEHWRIITPSEPERRGAQVSILLGDGLLKGVTAGLEKRGVLVDERRPNAIRIAPAALYNSFEDVWRFVRAFGEALGEAVKERGPVEKGDVLPEKTSIDALPEKVGADVPPKNASADTVLEKTSTGAPPEEARANAPPGPPKQTATVEDAPED